MENHMTYNTISKVLVSWEFARRQPGFEERVGLLTLQRLFELESRTKEVFGFDRSFDPTDEQLKKSGNLIHAIRMIHMFDAALSMLGPDTDTLKEILQELGKRHIKYNVKPQYYGFMGKSLIFALQAELKDMWNDQIEDAWVEVYDALSSEIMKSILNNR